MVFDASTGVTEPAIILTPPSGVCYNQPYAKAKLCDCRIGGARRCSNGGSGSNRGAQPIFPSALVLYALRPAGGPHDEVSQRRLSSCREARWRENAGILQPRDRRTQPVYFGHGSISVHERAGILGGAHGRRQGFSNRGRMPTTSSATQHTSASRRSSYAPSMEFPS